MSKTQELATVTPERMLMVAVEQGADLAKLEKLMDLQERWEAKEAKKAFVSALNKFKASAPQIEKDAEVSYKNTHYRHATLGNICRTIGEALGAVGISYRWDTNQESQFIKVTCILMHDAGHSERVSLAAAADQSGGKNNIQALGSTVSYLQRYTLLAATGMATSAQDDDGHAASGEQQEPPHREQMRNIPERDTYSPERFAENLPKWKELVQAGTQTAESIISMLESRAVITEEQKQAIQELEK